MLLVPKGSASIEEDPTPRPNSEAAINLRARSSTRSMSAIEVARRSAMSLRSMTMAEAHSTKLSMPKARSATCDSSRTRGARGCAAPRESRFRRCGERRMSRRWRVALATKALAGAEVRRPDARIGGASHRPLVFRRRRRYRATSRPAKRACLCSVTGAFVSDGSRRSRMRGSAEGGYHRGRRHGRGTRGGPEPIRRSTKGFCQGARGALNTSSMPMRVSRSRKVEP